MVAVVLAGTLGERLLHRARGHAADEDSLEGQIEELSSSVEHGMRTCAVLCTLLLILGSRWFESQGVLEQACMILHSCGLGWAG